MGGLGYRHFGRLQRRVQIFGGSENIFFVIFGRCTFVYVCVICPSLVLGGCWRPGYKAAVCFWLCYADVCLIPLSNCCLRLISHSTTTIHHIAYANCRVACCLFGHHAPCFITVSASRFMQHVSLINMRIRKKDCLSVVRRLHALL